MGRSKRSIFLEGSNEYVRDMNEYVMLTYAEQIKSAFTNSSKQIKKILDMRKPNEVTKKDTEGLEKMMKRAQELKEKFDKDEDFVFESSTKEMPKVEK